MCTGDVAERDRYEKVTYKSQRNAVMCVGACLFRINVDVLNGSKFTMQTMYMERTNSMKGGRKRSPEDGGGGADEEQQRPYRKRPALASVIVEALKVDSLQKFCSSLEPILRRVAESAIAALKRSGAVLSEMWKYILD